MNRIILDCAPCRVETSGARVGAALGAARAIEYAAAEKHPIRLGMDGPVWGLVHRKEKRAQMKWVRDYSTQDGLTFYKEHKEKCQRTFRRGERAFSAP